MKTPWAYLREYPPIYVRLLAKHSGSGLSENFAITDEEIAINSDIPIDRVREIAMMDEWSECTYAEMRAFIIACKFDPTNRLDRRRATSYEILCTKRNSIPFRYLRNSPKYESQFLPLLQKLPEVLEKQRGASDVTQQASRPTRFQSSREVTHAT